MKPIPYILVLISLILVAGCCSEANNELGSYEYHRQVNSRFISICYHEAPNQDEHDKCVKNYWYKYYQCLNIFPFPDTEVSEKCIDNIVRKK